jgi:small multidrug resistance family-3 protein
VSPAAFILKTGGLFLATALVWLRVVDGVRLSDYDWGGALVALLGMAIIVVGWQNGA